MFAYTCHTWAGAYNTTPSGGYCASITVASLPHMQRRTAHQQNIFHTAFNWYTLHTAIRFKSLIYENCWLYLQWNCIARHGTTQIYILYACQRTRTATRCNDNWFGFFNLSSYWSKSVFWFGFAMLTGTQTISVTAVDTMDDAFETRNCWTTSLNLVSNPEW